MIRCINDMDSLLDHPLRVLDGGDTLNIMGTCKAVFLRTGSYRSCVQALVAPLELVTSYLATRYWVLEAGVSMVETMSLAFAEFTEDGADRVGSIAAGLSPRRRGACRCAWPSGARAP